MELKKVEEVVVNGETIYLKKDMFGFRIIRPIKNSNGTINKINLIIGGWRNLVSLLFILALIGMFIYVYHRDISVIENTYQNISADPIAWCKNVNLNPSAYRTPQINFSELNLTLN